MPDGHGRNPVFYINAIDVLARRVPLRRALLLLLLLALLPLAILALLQGLSRLDRDRQALADRLRESALLTATSEQTVIDTTEGILRMLGRDIALQSADRETCETNLQDALGNLQGYANFFVIGPEGRIRCAAVTDETPSTTTPRTQPHETVWWEELVETRQLVVTPPIWGTYSQRRVFWTLLPVIDDNGNLAGAVSASIDYEWLQDSIRDRYDSNRAVVMILDPAGVPIVSSRDISWGRFDVSGPPGSIREVADEHGREWFYAVAPVTSGHGSGREVRFHVAYIGGTTNAEGPDWWFVGGHVALPILALLFASAAILIGTNWGILRWIQSLRGLAAEYQQGNYRTRRDSFEEAPQELRDLAASLYRMAHAIDQRDTRLHEAMARERALAREVNHRVKNNLQIIISLLALQGRTITDDKGRAALGNARLRVGSLALVHRLLYETDELATVSTSRMFHDLCGLIEQHFAVPNVRVICDIEDVAMDIDRAVPVTLWAVEILSDLLQRLKDSGPHEITLKLRRTADENIEITVNDPSGGAASSQAIRLLTAIARQLGGQVSVTDNSGASAVKLSFPVNR